MSAPVSSLARGRARDLIRRLGEAESAYDKAAGHLLEPFQAGDCPRKPKRLEQRLRRLGKQWQHELPAFGRLRQHVAQHGSERINLGDIRCRATTLSRAEWSEPGIAVALRSIIVQPQAALVDNTWNICTIGLHAIARRVERADQHDDAALLEDVLDLALQWPKHLGSRPAEFVEGPWRGGVGGLDHTLNARTFLPEIPGARFTYYDQQGRVCISYDGRMPGLHGGLL